MLFQSLRFAAIFAAALLCLCSCHTTHDVEHSASLSSVQSSTNVGVSSSLRLDSIWKALSLKLDSFDLWLFSVTPSSSDEDTLRFPVFVDSTISPSATPAVAPAVPKAQLSSAAHLSGKGLALNSSSLAHQREAETEEFCCEYEDYEDWCEYDDDLAQSTQIVEPPDTNARHASHRAFRWGFGIAAALIVIALAFWRSGRLRSLLLKACAMIKALF